MTSSASRKAWDSSHGAAAAHTLKARGSMCLQQRMKLSKGVVLSITVIICHVLVHAAGVRVVVVADGGKCVCH